MGGQAFANTPTTLGKPVQIPRLSPELYKTLCAKYQVVLETLFERVVIPRDVPWKTSHGDIDFLVDGIRPPTTKGGVWAAIQTALKAELHIANGESSNYAIPHPEIQDAHVQVDVELSVGDGTSDSAALFDWTRFLKSDGDLLQIVGITHRSLGLTCNDQGLHVRIREIEPYNKKLALLFLTRDPNKAMEFYGFEPDKYWAGFTGENDLFTWVANGRFFSHEIFGRRVEKSNDRTRQAKRPMYQRFVEEFMPANPDTGADIGWTREEVLHDALTAFNKQEEYDTMLEEHHLKDAEEELWKDIRAAIGVTSKSLPTILKGLRRWVIFKDGQPNVTSDEPNLEKPLMWSKFVTAENKDGVLQWVTINWEHVKMLEKARANAVKALAKKG